MPEISAASLIATVALAVAFAAIAWVAWLLLCERVRCTDRELIKKHGWRKESLALSDIVQIDFHYHAVVGFISSWEFVSRSGASLHIDGRATGITAALHTLETNLPGFSLAEFQRKFKEGDVEDTIEIWRAGEGAS